MENNDEDFPNKSVSVYLENFLENKPKTLQKIRAKQHKISKK